MPLCGKEDFFMNRVKIAAAAFLSLCLLVSSAPGQGKASGSQGNPTVVLNTTMGTIKVDLFESKAPVTVKNFLEYVKSGFYDGTIVHRVDFVIGLGGYTQALTGKPTRPGIKNESKNGLKNLRGTLAMARYDDPNSATSQFFINLKNNPHLDPSGSGFGYAVFGKVIEGMDVVDKIAATKRGNKGPFANIPLQTIVVKSAKVLSN
jgi:cyclophilin family peptidyl-prolyl cis-trans isomerase